MALVTNTWGRATSTPTAAAAPTTSETIANPTKTRLRVVVGGTATTITVVRPGNNRAGDAVADYVIGPVTNTVRDIAITREYADPVTGLVTVNFSQVTGVTAELIRYGAS